MISCWPRPRFRRTWSKPSETFAEHGVEILSAITSTEENAKYIGGTFNPTVTDTDYDVVRKMFANIGITEFTEFVGE